VCSKVPEKRKSGEKGKNCLKIAIFEAGSV